MRGKRGRRGVGGKQEIPDLKRETPFAFNAKRTNRSESLFAEQKLEFYHTNVSYSEMIYYIRSTNDPLFDHLLLLKKRDSRM